MTAQRTPFTDLPPATQAGILCNEQQFKDFLSNRHNHADDPAHFIRNHCGIESRRDLNTDTHAAALFQTLRTEYDAWRGAIPQPRD